MSKKLLLYFVMLMSSFYHVHTCENSLSTAELLTQSSYDYHEIEHITILFTAKHEAHAACNVPSVQEIIAQISQLQNEQGNITNEYEQQQALNALKTVLKATNHALLCINQELNKQQEIELFLIEQKRAIVRKIQEISPLSTWQYLTQSPAVNAAVACVVTTLVLAGVTYYFDLLDLKTHHMPIIPTMPTTNTTKQVYQEINAMLAQFLDPQDKSPLSIYITASKEFRQKLLNDSQNNAILIGVLETVIESENRMDCGFRSREQLSNDLFWARILYNKDYYTSVFNQISQRNISDIDFKQLWEDKGWI